MSEEKHNAEDVAVPELETPPAPDLPAKGIETLFAEDSLAAAAAKLVVVEAFLVLSTKNYKFHEFMREILLSIMKVIKSEAGSILEVDNENKVLFFRSVVGQSSDQLTKFIVPIGKGIVGHVAESRQPLVVNNVEENRVHLKAIQDAVGFEARNLVAVPIIIRGQVFGVLELLNRLGEENFSRTDIELLTYLCHMAAKTIEIRMMISFGSESEQAPANESSEKSSTSSSNNNSEQEVA